MQGQISLGAGMNNDCLQSIYRLSDLLHRDEKHERDSSESGAVLNPTHRYLLWRHWNHYGQVLPWIMLNPSTADAQTDDPTIRRCIGFARAWGYGGILVANLFALRSTDPEQLAAAADPVGEGNDLTGIACRSPLIVCAWGRLGRFNNRAAAVLELVRAHGATPMCLGVNGDKSPKHPLYVRASTKLMEVPL